MKYLATLTILLAASCASLPNDPQSLGDQLIADLDAGYTGQAEEAFSRIEGNASAKDNLYPVLFGEARDRYEAEDFRGAVTILRFSAGRYPTAESLQEAYLLSLFQLRAQVETPDSGILRELDSVVRRLQDGGVESRWADLIAVQTAIDRGMPNEALEPYRRFLTAWKGEPAELETYVMDLGRYLENPPTMGVESGQ